MTDNDSINTSLNEAKPVDVSDVKSKHVEVLSFDSGNGSQGDCFTYKTKEGNSRVISNKKLYRNEVEKHLIDQLSNDQKNKMYQVIDIFDKESKTLISPPFDPLILACYLEHNTRLMRSVHFRARQSVGLGWRLEINEDINIEDNPDLKKEIEKEKAQVKELLDNPNDDLPLSEILFRVKVDEEATGNGYLEVLRGLNGDISGLDYLPSHTMRISKNGLFVQMRGQKKVYFKPFGDRRHIDLRNGDEKDRKDDIPAKYYASEVIHKKIHSPRSSYYGIPRWIPAIAAIVGNRLVSRRNISFFENDATPKVIVVVNNGELSTKSVRSIQDFVNRDGKGVENSSRIMVLQPNQKRVIGEKGKPVKIDVIPLNLNKDEDASFQKYRKLNDEEIRESFGIAIPFFSSEGTNRSNARELKKITIQQEFIPDLKLYEYILNRKILGDFGVENIRIELERPQELDKVDKSQLHKVYSNIGAMSINEVRMQNGWEPFPEEFVFARLPYSLVKNLLEFGLVGQPFISSKSSNNSEDPMDIDESQQGDSSLDNGEESEIPISNPEDLLEGNIEKFSPSMRLFSGKEGSHGTDDLDDLKLLNAKIVKELSAILNGEVK